ncbi:hypothetical protein PHYPSEUDO_005959 [Phytophthora pseudosyringae]|uniref:Uncharacterized protein n=1 Tax=Phytophthora pseudosyringae TaxID=221518 RepID=A0A8T1VJW8_9STRA|nr:hypothetical protein PHYPSEUDO_005959 [Phytophthora pseudosyringae]
MAESAPPPPPPLSPPPALETTTIGKYIARFRYEQPQPREARVAAQRSDFWWTKSPRYARSPSPPSTWASGGVFAFPDEEEELEEELAAKMEKEQGKNEVEDDGDSVESTLRRRLGLDSSEARQGTSHQGEVPQVAHSWGSVDWGSVDLEEEEEEEEEEDPEKVIERVRRRLGWGATAVGLASSTASRLKPIDFRLSVDADRRDPGRRQEGLKPPLSPGSFRKGESLDSLGARSDSSWGSMQQQRDRGADRFEEAASLTSSPDTKENRQRALEVDGKEGENRSPSASVSLADGNEAENDHGRLSPTDVAALELRSNSSSVSSIRSRGSEPHEASDDALSGPVNERFKEVPSPTSSLLDTSERNLSVERQEEKPQVCREIQEHSVANTELPLISTASPARPALAQELGSPPSNDNISGYFRGPNSPSISREKLVVPSETTTKTLNNLVSLVVHSWENDFFSTFECEQEEGELTDDKQEPVTESKEDSNGIGDTCHAPASPNVDLPTPSNGSSEDKATNSDILDPTTTEFTTEIAVRETVSTETINPPKEEPTQPDPDNEEKEENEVPGEEDDQLVQMLLGRIALLEEALSQIDS